jgi:hypothetical protein
MAKLVGIFELPAPAAAAVKQLKGRGYTDVETYAPAPFAEVDDSVHPKPSRVRIMTLIGGVAGVLTGYGMTIWMANNWQLMVGSKPFSSIPPYTIIAFELAILFGGIMTVVGLILFGDLPKFKLDATYSARFSAEDFGVVVRCRDQDVAEIDSLLRENDAMEVNLVES